MIHSNAFGYVRFGFLGHAFAGDPLLVKGARGTAVAEAQSLLVQAGYPVGRSGADGVFGPGTEAAVIKYNADKLARSSNAVDQTMWDSLRASPKVVAPPAMPADVAASQGAAGFSLPSSVADLPWGWIGAGVLGFVGIVALSRRSRRAEG